MIRLCHRLVRAAVFSSLVIASAWAPPANGDILIGHFSQRSLSDWHSRSFKGETRYELVEDSDLNLTVLSATSDGAASGLYKEIKIDLTETPYLNWSWKVTRIFSNIDESVKAGDDFPARVYVVVKRGVLGMRSLALNYVWASRYPVGSDWPSPYTEQVRMMAVDSGEQQLGSWVRRKRNIRGDLKKVFGEEITQIDAVAVMTDTDNHKGRARTYYGDIWFSGQ